MWPPVALLIGPSGSGKSPLGAEIARRGLPGIRQIHHFDFGEHLRRICRGDNLAKLGPVDLAYVRSIMNGSLLADDHLYIAERIIAGFCKERNVVAGRDLLLLNGMPRSVSQARFLQKAGIRYVCVVVLECDSDVAAARRVMAERGGGHEDRRGRGDAGVEVSRRKQASYQNDTLPLVPFLEYAGVRLVRVAATVTTTPEHMYTLIRGAVTWV